MCDESLECRQGRDRCTAVQLCSRSDSLGHLSLRRTSAQRFCRLCAGQGKVQEAGWWSDLHDPQRAVHLWYDLPYKWDEAGGLGVVQLHSQHILGAWQCENPHWRQHRPTGHAEAQEGVSSIWLLSAGLFINVSKFRINQPD